MKPDIEKRMDLAIQAAREAGRVVMRSFGKVGSFTSKGERELVCEVDLEAEATIVRLIRESFPSDNVLCEEGKYPRSSSDIIWIIDALDGTHNYIHNIEVFGTSIALALKDEIVIGVIYMPVTDELYLGERGGGAYLNGEKISVSNRGPMEATVIYDSRIIWNKEITIPCLNALVDQVFNIRMFGSSARSLTYLAQGKVDGEIEFDDKVWDFAAGLLLVEEAGGVATDFQGERWNTRTSQFVASNGKIHKNLLKAVSSAGHPPLR